VDKESGWAFICLPRSKRRCKKVKEWIRKSVELAKNGKGDEGATFLIVPCSLLRLKNQVCKNYEALGGIKMY
jgi:hypothetical protein